MEASDQSASFHGRNHNLFTVSDVYSRNKDSYLTNRLRVVLPMPIEYVRPIGSMPHNFAANERTFWSRQLRLLRLPAPIATTHNMFLEKPSVFVYPRGVRLLVNRVIFAVGSLLKQKLLDLHQS